MKINDIPQFTKEDFLETEKPYEFVCKKVKSDFEKEQIKVTVNENARKVGIANFEKMLFYYEKMLRLNAGERVRGAKY